MTIKIRMTRKGLSPSLHAGNAQPEALKQGTVLSTREAVNDAFRTRFGVGNLRKWTLHGRPAT